MMIERVRVSVCMATFNGALYLTEQIESILRQLQAGDELVVVDDASTDESAQIVASFGDARIRLMVNEHNAGHVRTFERALAAASGDVLMLSDQDDVWAEGRVAYLLHELEGVGMVASNFDHVSLASGEPSERRLKASSSTVGDLVGLALGRRPYYGCTMVFSREFITLALPFPQATQAHDHWLAILGIVSRSLRHAPEVTVHRRLHDGNLSPRTRRALGPVVHTRVRMASHVFDAAVRLVVVASSRLRRERT